MGSGLVRGALAVATVAVLAACGSPSEARRVDAGGVSLLVPSDWRAIDAKAALASSSMQELLEENPEWRGQLEALMTPSSPIALLAFSHGEERGSLSVYVYRDVPAETTESFVQRTLAALRRLPGFHLFQRRSPRIAGVRAGELRYVVAYRARSGSVPLHTLQTFVVRGGNEYSVTYSGDPKTFAARRALFRRSIATMRIS